MPHAPPAPHAPHAPTLLRAIADMLADLAADAENFGVALCGDADVVARHLVELQQIDRLAQSLREMARVLASPDPAQAVADICLSDLRLVLEHAGAR